MSLTPAMAPHLLSQQDPINNPNIIPFDTIPDRSSMTSMSSKRPKLSLKTSDLASTYVNSTTGRTDVNVHATTTPTNLNTFTNTFDLTYRPSPISTIPSPGPTLSRRPTNLNTQSSPYILNLPFGVYPILKNSPLSQSIRRPSLATASASPRIAGRRIFFPAPKKVSFKPILEEEIVTTEYVTRHADLTSSDEDTTTSDSDSSHQTSDDRKDDTNRRIIRVDESSRGRNKRKTMTAFESSPREDRGRSDRSRSTSERRTKRKKRRWEWTITETATPSEATGSPETKANHPNARDEERDGEVDDS
ncbi:hypothetical protein LTR84_010725 [Exophiala bonariae]|uniref:Uncharacterized protein n=1 Tax=Exophiala bonariae TaxID=1690606 RepID=A0AAV9MSS8_9EURO|nr:hypothetical protein LTR84_010725 [Exophiala bonariae]